MQSLDEAVETLVNLGLTVLQAKVYITLAKLDTLTGRETAKAAKVAPQDVYRILTELQETGLAEKLISKPNKYRAMPLEEGLLMLLGRRKNQTKELEQAVNAVSREFNYPLKEAEKSDIGDFILVPKKQPNQNKVNKIFETAQTSIDMMNEVQDGLIGHEKIFNIEIKALSRGVKIRDILSKRAPTFQTTKTFSTLLQKYPKFQVRYIDFPAPARLILKDNKEVFLSTTNKANTFLQPFLWSDNQILVQLIQQWYDNMWEKSSAENFVLQMPHRQSR